MPEPLPVHLFGKTARYTNRRWIVCPDAKSKPYGYECQLNEKPCAQYEQFLDHPMHSLDPSEYICRFYWEATEEERLYGCLFAQGED